MIGASNHSDDRDDKLRRALKDMPAVHASPDFEQRLQRRINEEELGGRTEGFFRKLFSPRRIPVVAYSLLTIVVVGVFSYYMFFRTDVSSIDESRTLPTVDEKTKPTLPVVPQLKQGSVESQSNAQPITKGKELQGKPVVPVPFNTESRISLEKKERIDQPVEDRDEAERSADSRVKMDAMQSAPTREDAGGIQVESGAPAQMMPQTEVQDKAAPFKKESAQRRAYRYSALAPSSQAVVDSLRKDSLQRVQRELQIFQQRSKVKKPDQ